MKINRLFFSLLFIFFVSACTKISETEIGTGLIPAIDGIITKDTNITIYAKNWTDVDTVRPSLSDDHALGYINDPLFGTTTAAINVQMQPTSFPFSFGVGSDSLTLDSVVLALAYRGVWGDSAQPLSLHVKELDNTQTFSYDSIYRNAMFVVYNNYSQFTASNDLTYNGVASRDLRLLNDSFHVFQDSGINMLRIRLTDDFGNRLLHTYDTANQYKTDSSFRSAFKGFQVSADAVGNALLKIGLASSGGAEPNTKLAIYYKRKTTSGTTDTTVTYFTVNTLGSTTVNVGSAHSNYIKRDLGAGQAGSYYSSANGSKNDNYLYIQSSPGTKALITIDSLALKKLPNLIIHRAEIIMEQSRDASSPLLDEFTSPYLFLLAKESDTSFFNIPGFDSSSLAASDAVFTSGILSNYSEFGGLPFKKNNTEGQKINYYNFNLSRYIQGIVTKKNMPYTFVLYTPYKEAFKLVKNIESYGRVASTPYNSAGIGRVKLYGGGDDTTNVHRMKLHIVYSVPH